MKEQILTAYAELDRYYTSIKIQSALACNARYRAFYKWYSYCLPNFCSNYYTSTHLNFSFASSSRLERHSSCYELFLLALYARADLRILNILLHSEDNTTLYLISLIIFLSRVVCKRSVCFKRIASLIVTVNTLIRVLYIVKTNIS